MVEKRQTTPDDRGKRPSVEEALDSLNADLKRKGKSPTDHRHLMEATIEKDSRKRRSQEEPVSKKLGSKS